jgi:predicted nucleic-acid-binding Zn-ribbon protein
MSYKGTEAQRILATEGTEKYKYMDAESRAPGWHIRCVKCGFTEPWGKYAICLAGWSWKKFTIGCRWLRFHSIEKRHSGS